MTFAEVVYRVATDLSFATHLQQEPRAALAAVGLPVENEEVTALLTVLRRKAGWRDLCSEAHIVPDGFPWPFAQFACDG